MTERSEVVHDGTVRESVDGHEFIPWCQCGWVGQPKVATTTSVNDEAHVKAFEDADIALREHLDWKATRPRCDHCKVPVHLDVNGWWVASDESADCPADDGGHAVAGAQRA